MEVESKYREPMAFFAEAIDKVLNMGKGAGQREHGFVLLMFEFGSGGADHRMNYISNAERETVVVALKELVANLEGRMMNTPGHA